MRVAGRKLNLPTELSNYDFAALSKRESDPKVRLRLLALHHFKSGKSATDIGEILQMQRQTATKWLTRFATYGLSSLKDKKRSGRPSLIPKDKLDELNQKILSLQKSRHGGRVIGRDIEELIATEYGICLGKDTVYSILKKMNLVWISARSKHPNKDDIAEIDFKKTLKKK